MCVLIACMCVHYVCDCCLQKPRRELDPLEPELQMVGGHHIGAENWTQVLYERSYLLSCLSRPLSPSLICFLPYLPSPFFWTAAGPEGSQGQTEPCEEGQHTGQHSFSTHHADHSLGSEAGPLSGHVDPGCGTPGEFCLALLCGFPGPF